MILPKKEDALHKIQLYRLLSAILDSRLGQFSFFKGGTCASMLGFSDRFSIDLDFDIKKIINKKMFSGQIIKIFQNLNLSIDKKSSRTFFYLLKYESSQGLRNTIKLSFIDSPYKSNIYKPFYLPEIDRYAVCQTVETMFSHKLVAVTDRYLKNKTIAGRDIYDIHHFFLAGYRYLDGIIEERIGKKTAEYLKELKRFIEEKISDKIISEDLSYLLPYDKFKLIRRVLKRETLMLIKDEIKRRE